MMATLDATIGITQTEGLDSEEDDNHQYITEYFDAIAECIGGAGDGNDHIQRHYTTNRTMGIPKDWDSENVDWKSPYACVVDGSMGDSIFH